MTTHPQSLQCADRGFSGWYSRRFEKGTGTADSGKLLSVMIQDLDVYGMDDGVYKVTRITRLGRVRARRGGLVIRMVEMLSSPSSNDRRMNVLLILLIETSHGVYLRSTSYIIRGLRLIIESHSLPGFEICQINYAFGR